MTLVARDTQGDRWVAVLQYHHKDKMALVASVYGKLPREPYRVVSYALSDFHWKVGK